MLHSPTRPMFDHGPFDVSRVARMFADWCDRQGAKTSITSHFKTNTLRVSATLDGHHIVACFDEFTGRFTRCGTVVPARQGEYWQRVPNEAYTVTTLKALADALTGKAVR